MNLQVGTPNKLGTHEFCNPKLLKPEALNGSFRNLGVPYLGVRIIRILLFRALYQGPLFSENPKPQTLNHTCPVSWGTQG